MSSSSSSAARRSLAFLEATREQVYIFDSAVFPLHLAVMFRTVFLTELWRVAVLPFNEEKEQWQNRNASGNNEAIELQMQQLPLCFLSRETQDALMRTYEPGLQPAAATSGLPPAATTGVDASAFLRAWVMRMHEWCRDKHVAIEVRNAHALHHLPVTTGDATVRHALTQSEIPDDTQLVFPGFEMPFPDGRARFPLICYLEPTVTLCGAPTQVSELALRARLFVVRARDNACFNVCCDAFFLCKEQYEDCAVAAPETYRAAHAAFVRAREGTTGKVDGGQAARAETIFKLRQVTDMYTYPFCWFAATSVLLARLQLMATKFESGEFRFVPSAEVVCPTGVVFEWILRAGQLSADWENEYLSSRSAAFDATGGLPLAFEKREVAEGYAELEYARFVGEQVLETCYGRTVSRVTCFERYDQDQMIVRVQPLTPQSLQTGDEVGRLFVHAAQECAQRLLAFYNTYRVSF